jgi:hypothetical protein
MPRHPPTPAVLTVAINELQALPAELTATFCAIHVATPSVLLDALGALWAILCLLLNESKTSVLFLKAILDAHLILLAGLIFMPWAVARDAGFGATVVAG